MISVEQLCRMEARADQSSEDIVALVDEVERLRDALYSIYVDSRYADNGPLIKHIEKSLGIPR